MRLGLDNKLIHKGFDGKVVAPIGNMGQTPGRCELGHDITSGFSHTGVHGPLQFSRESPAAEKHSNFVSENIGATPEPRPTHNTGEDIKLPWGLCSLQIHIQVIQPSMSRQAAEGNRGLDTNSGRCRSHQKPFKAVTLSHRSIRYWCLRYMQRCFYCLQPASETRWRRLMRRETTMAVFFLFLFGNSIKFIV